MANVSISELKANLSRYLREVRRGGEVQVLDRGRPIARLSKIDSGSGRDDHHRARLAAAGVLRPGEGNASAILSRQPLALPTSILAALAEERADRL